ncbi:MAG: hypothetical protein HQK86_11215 [Nitrospinae bacterium]|nr:hypothetical protein [Nitrospinota bacterium]MBF0634669.1 hypothetical protein [Nitrospinota bacterium]
MYGWGWGRYVSVAEKRKNAKKAVARMLKKGKTVRPVTLEGRTLAKTFWGKAWNSHLESFSDYDNRLPRGRSYVRNGSVVDLTVESGRIEALVMGSSLYRVQIEIKSVDDKKWRTIMDNCSGQIDSVIELLQGKLSSGVMKTITDRHNGLFPLPTEISLNCSCPDWATMCKHVAATLYGVGARLDNEPELLFKLRKVDHLELITVASMKTPARRSGKANVLQDQNLSEMFGIDVVIETVSTGDVKKPKAKPSAKKAAKKKTTAKAKKKSVTIKRKGRTVPDNKT